MGNDPFSILYSGVFDVFGNFDVFKQWFRFRNVIRFDQEQRRDPEKQNSQTADRPELALFATGIDLGSRNSNQYRLTQRLDLRILTDTTDVRVLNSLKFFSIACMENEAKKKNFYSLQFRDRTFITHIGLAQGTSTEGRQGDQDNNPIGGQLTVLPLQCEFELSRFQLNLDDWMPNL